MLTTSEQVYIFMMLWWLCMFTYNAYANESAYCYYGGRYGYRTIGVYIC